MKSALSRSPALSRSRAVSAMWRAVSASPGHGGSTLGFSAQQITSPEWMLAFEQTKKSIHLAATQRSTAVTNEAIYTGTSADALSPFVVPDHRLVFCKRLQRSAREEWVA